jgi:hypothetical protein
MPDELHKRFKLACVQEETEMSELIRKWIEQYVQKIEKKAKR